MEQIVVECHDLTYHNSWMCQDEIDEAHLIDVVVSGVVVGESDTELKISSLYSPETERSGYTIVVPKGCIVSRRVV